MNDPILKDQWNPVMKKAKKTAIVISLLMIVLGAVMLFNPFGSMKAAVWFLIASVLIYGILHILMYVGLPSFLKHGTDLGIGILWIVFGIVLIFGAIFTDSESKKLFVEKFSSIIGVILGVSCCFTAIRAFCSVPELKNMGYSGLGCIIGGILLVLVGVFMIVNPLSAVMKLVSLWGIFSIIVGISTLSRVLSL